MIDIDAEIARVKRRLKHSSNPQEILEAAWIEAMKKYDHCDDIKTALTSLCKQLVTKHYRLLTLSEMLKPHLDEVYRQKRLAGKGAHSNKESEDK